MCRALAKSNKLGIGRLTQAQAHSSCIHETTEGLSSKRMKDNLSLVVCPATYMLLSFDRARVHETCTKRGVGERGRVSCIK